MCFALKHILESDRPFSTTKIKSKKKKIKKILPHTCSNPPQHSVCSHMIFFCLFTLCKCTFFRHAHSFFAFLEPRMIWVADPIGDFGVVSIKRVFQALSRFLLC